MTNIRARAATLTAVVLVLAACGGADGGSDTGDSLPAATTVTDAPETGDPGTDTGSSDVPVTGVPVTDVPPTDVAVTDPPDQPGDQGTTAPPPVVLRRGGERLSLTAVTYCWTPEGEGFGICSDGMRPDPLPVLGGEGPITVEFPAALEFTFGVTVWDDDYETVLASPATTESADGVTFDPPEDVPVRVDIFGSGPAGDVFVAVLIT